jgi:hypothetical protein
MALLQRQLLLLLLLLLLQVWLPLLQECQGVAVRCRS